MQQTEDRTGSISTARAMTRAEFLRFAARVAGACAAGGVLGPATLAFGAEIEAAPARFRARQRILARTGGTGATAPPQRAVYICAFDFRPGAAGGT